MKKKLLMIASLLLVIVLMITVFTSSVSAASMTEEQAVKAGFEVYKAWHIVNFSGYNYKVNEYESAYQATVKDHESDPIWKSLLAAWRISTFNINSEADYAKKEYGYYEALLFNMLYDENTQSLTQSFLTQYNKDLKSVNKIQKALASSAIGKVADLYKKVAGETTVFDPDAPVNEENAAEAFKVFLACDEIKDACKVIGDVTKIISYCSDFMDLIERISKVQVVLNCSKDVNIVLSRMNANGNPLLQKAIDNFKAYTSGEMTEETAVAIFTGRKTMEIALNEGASFIYKKVLSSLKIYGAAIEAGQTVGKFAADALFNSSSTVSSYYELRATANFEQSIKGAVKSLENAANTEYARAFNSAVAMLYKTYIYGLDKYKSYLEKAVYDATVVDRLTGCNDEEFDSVKKDLNFLQNCFKEGMIVDEESLTEAYNYSRTVYAPQYSDSIEIPLLPEIDEIRDKYNNDLNNAEAVSWGLYGEFSERDYTLTSDVTVCGDLNVKNCTLNLNGHKLTITHNLIIDNSGTINIPTDSTLTVNGSICQINSSQVNITGGVLEAKGKYNISYNVFNEKLCNNAYFNITNGSLNLYNGGNWWIYESDWRTPIQFKSPGEINFYGGELKYEINGYQNIDKNFAFNAKGSDFKLTSLSEGSSPVNLVVENASSKKIGLSGYVKFNEILGDGTVNFVSDDAILDIGSLKQNAIIKGDTEFRNVTVDNYKLTVDGSIYQINSSSQVNITGGVLEAKGKYNISYNVFDEKLSNNAYFNITNGSLNLYNGGNWWIYESDWRTPIQFKSPGEINFYGGELKYEINGYQDIDKNFQVNILGNNLKIENINSQPLNLYILNSADKKLTIRGEANTITSSDSKIHLISDHATLKNFNLSDCDVTIDGDVSFDGTNTFNNCNVTVNGNLIAGSYSNGTYSGSSIGLIAKNNSEININGKLLWYASGSGSNYGIHVEDTSKLNVYGDEFTYRGGTCSVDSTAQFNFRGKTDFHINAVNALNCSRLIIENADQRTITVSGNFTLDSLAGDNIIIKSDNATLTLNNLDGDLTVNGDVILCIKTASRGNVTVNGDLTTNGNVQLNGYSMTVNGNLNMKTGTLDVNRNTLTVNGNIIHTSGTIYVNGGRVYVTSNYIMANVIDTNTYQSVSAYLKMTDVHDVVTIGGDMFTFSSGTSSSYLTSGRLEIAGNFTQYGSYSFICSGTHETILNGEKIQYVTFENTSTTFNLLYLAQSFENYVFNPGKCWNTLEDSPYVLPELRPQIWGIVVIPKSFTANVNEQIQFHSTLYTKNDPDCTLIWTVTGNKSKHTTISDNGLLSIGKDETASQLIVTATSVFDVSVSASVTVDIIQTEVTVIVDKVIIYPGDIIILQGDTYGLSSAVTGVNTADMKILWQLSGNTSKSTYIDSNGVIHIASDEQGGNDLTVKAYADGYPEKSATINVHVVMLPKITPTYTYDTPVYVGQKSEEIVLTASYGDTPGVITMNPGQTIKAGKNTLTWTFVPDDTQKYASVSGVIEIVVETGSDCDVDGHKYTSKVTKAATCTANGEMTYTCLVCGDTYTKEISATGHTESAWITDKNSDCVNSGSKHIECTVCGVTLKTQVIPTNDHSYKAVVTKPTCTTDGYTTHTCTVCGNSYTDTVVKAAGHKAVTEKAVAATCKKSGKTEGSHCSVCGTVIKSQTTVAKKAHTYKNVVTKATLTKNGKIVPTCSVCKATKTAATVYYPKTIKLSETSATYTGKAIKPKVTVTDSNGKAIAASNYTVSYKNNTKVGTATVTVTFKGNYSGTKTLTFKIVPGQVKNLKASKVTTTAVKLAWSKVTGAKYYKIEQSTDGKNWKTVKTTDKTTYTVTKLKTGAKYRFRVTALDSTKKIAGKVSSVLKTGTKTAAPKVTLKSTKSKTATASWKKVTGASKYIVYKSTNNKKWTKVGSTTKLSYKLSKLSGGKKIYVKVIAVNAYKQNSAYSKVTSVTVKK